MRNGFNIAAISEVINEICADSREAVIRFNSRCTRIGNDIAVANIAPIVTGSIRIARDYSLLIGRDGEKMSWRRGTAAEYFLAGIGGCVIVTYMQGCSIKDLTIIDLELDIEADYITPTADNDCGAFRNIRYRVNLDVDAPQHVLKEIAEDVCAFSANHRTIIESNSACAHLFVEDDDAHVITHEEIPLDPEFKLKRRSQDDEGGEYETIAVKLQWQYGTQFGATIRTQSHRDNGLSIPIECEIDQPKQYAGIDKAPNPQEYLLAGLAEEALTRIEEAGRRAAISWNDLRVTTSGSLDFRGVANLSSDARVRVHDIRYDIHIKTCAPSRLIADLIRDVIPGGLLHQSVVNKNCIQVTLNSRDKQVLSALSRSDGLFAAESAQTDVQQ